VIALVVWLIVGALSVAFLAVSLVGLVRQVKIVGRAAQRFGDEVAPSLDVIRAEGDRSRTRLEQLPDRIPTNGGGGRIRR
jgi:hypothetical protein